MAGWSEYPLDIFAAALKSVLCRFALLVASAFIGSWVGCCIATKELPDFHGTFLPIFAGTVAWLVSPWYCAGVGATILLSAAAVRSDKLRIRVLALLASIMVWGWLSYFFWGGPGG